MNGVKWRAAAMPSNACCHQRFNCASENGPIVLVSASHQPSVMCSSYSRWSSGSYDKEHTSSGRGLGKVASNSSGGIGGEIAKE